MLRKIPDGCLPRITRTNFYTFSNVMMVNIPEELLKPGEHSLQLATINPSIDAESWPADEYVRKFIPDYPQKKVVSKDKGKEKTNEEIEKSDSKQALTEKALQSLSPKNKKRTNAPKKMGHVKRRYTNSNHNIGMRQMSRKPNVNHQNRHSNGPIPYQHRSEIYPWLPNADPNLSLNSIGGPLCNQLGTNYMENNRPDRNAFERFPRPEHNSSFDRLPRPDHNTSFDRLPRPDHNTSFDRLPRPEHNASFERIGPSNAPFYESFSNNNPRPIKNAYVERKLGLLGHCPAPAVSNSFENSFSEPPALNEPLNHYHEFQAPNKSNYANAGYDYAGYDSEPSGWDVNTNVHRRLGSWEDNSQDYPQSAYQRNYAVKTISAPTSIINCPENSQWNQVNLRRPRRSRYRGINRRGQWHPRNRRNAL